MFNALFCTVSSIFIFSSFQGHQTWTENSRCGRTFVLDIWPRTKFPLFAAYTTLSRGFQRRMENHSNVFLLANSLQFYAVYIILELWLFLPTWSTLQLGMLNCIPQSTVHLNKRSKPGWRAFLSSFVLTLWPSFVSSAFFLMIL